MGLKIESGEFKDLITRLVRYLIFMDIVEIDFDLYREDGMYLVKNIASVMDENKALKLENELIDVYVDFTKGVLMHQRGLELVYLTYEKKLEAKKKTRS